MVGFEFDPFRLRSEHGTTELRGLMSVKGLKFTGFNPSVLFQKLETCRKG